MTKPESNNFFFLFFFLFDSLIMKLKRLQILLLTTGISKSRQVYTNSIYINSVFRMGLFAVVHTYWCVLMLFYIPTEEKNNSPELSYRCIIQLIQSRRWLKIWLLFLVNIYVAFLMCQELRVCIFNHLTSQGDMWLWNVKVISKVLNLVNG